MLILLSLPRTSLAESVNSDSWITKGSPARLDGWLLDDRAYRYYRAQDAKAEMLDEELNQLDLLNDSSLSLEEKILWTGVGILLGGATMYLINAKK